MNRPATPESGPAGSHSTDEETEHHKDVSSGLPDSKAKLSLLKKGRGRMSSALRGADPSVSNSRGAGRGGKMGRAPLRLLSCQPCSCEPGPTTRGDPGPTSHLIPGTLGTSGDLEGAAQGTPAPGPDPTSFHQAPMLVSVAQTTEASGNSHPHFWQRDEKWRRNRFFFLFLFFFFRAHTEVPKLGVESELQPPAYIPATAVPGQSRV